jgi:hypothetical protein
MPPLGSGGLCNPKRCRNGLTEHWGHGEPQSAVSDLSHQQDWQRSAGNFAKLASQIIEWPVTSPFRGPAPQDTHAAPIPIIQVEDILRVTTAYLNLIAETMRSNGV